MQKEEINPDIIFLPIDVDPNWFDIPFEKIENKSHLIKIKHVPKIDTVANRFNEGNRTYDIKGDISNPKIIVSPWMDSTIEPDYNIKPLN